MTSSFFSTALATITMASVQTVEASKTTLTGA
ncbi:hypothetical protein CCHOA_07730 [Corynebacterium choanae]|uniref:Uncharacterized protein n=1 Tax=Corynebacterium choanae TaxID=1862358 RepID=A0A3G6JAJ9_9CORY|nr:hypothetical protein CCHOA_07730 [Corynebacterium choanae]